jgi:hypothetical protein
VFRQPSAMVAIAARIGKTRLIDNGRARPSSVSLGPRSVAGCR